MNTKKTMTYADEKQGISLGEVQNCGGDKPIYGIQASSWYLNHRYKEDNKKHEHIRFN